jgi:hypothetical protein
MAPRFAGSARPLRLPSARPGSYLATPCRGTTHRDPGKVGAEQAESTPPSRRFRQQENQFRHYVNRSGLPI